MQRFTSYYSAQHSGRKLNWLYNMCRGELTTNCFKQKFTLQASTFQMAVLLQFNEKTALTVQQLAENTRQKEEDMKQVLQILLKFKLLLSRDEETPLNSESVIDLNAEFKKWVFVFLFGIAATAIVIKFNSNVVFIAVRSCGSTSTIR